MPNLGESLQGRDLGHLRIIAEFWGLELADQDIKAALSYLTSSMLSPDRVAEVINVLTPGEKDALADLSTQGKIPLAQFSRSYGEVREMGVAKRDREQPYKQPVSTAEALWYKGLVARAFFDTTAGPEEFVYIPDDLLPHIPLDAAGKSLLMGRQASNTEHAKITLANDRILDHACTLLAASRLGFALQDPFLTSAGEELTPQILKLLLVVSGLLDENGMPFPEPVRQFLEAGRAEALVELFQSWRQSDQFNELYMLPGLSPEGNWTNDPHRARQAIVEHIAGLPPDTWWSLGSFIAAIMKHNPDFQRPAGDYDSWFIRDLRSGEFLRGFENWDIIDGRLVQFILAGPLHWLGVVDLAFPEGSSKISAFRLSSWSKALLKGEPPRGLPVEKELISIRSDARLSAPRLAPRRIRYQLARFCEWDKETHNEYQYRISAESLRKARKQGLSVKQLLALINKHSKAVPPSLVRALERWDKLGSEARLEKVLILRVSSAEVLQLLLKSRASRFLGEPLGPTLIGIKPGAAQKVLGALAELGYLGELRGEDDSL